jgi:hypothetical protein
VWLQFATEQQYEQQQQQQQQRAQQQSSMQQMQMQQLQMQQQFQQNLQDSGLNSSTDPAAHAQMQLQHQQAQAQLQQQQQQLLAQQQMSLQQQYDGSSMGGGMSGGGGMGGGMGGHLGGGPYSGGGGGQYDSLLGPDTEQSQILEQLPIVLQVLLSQAHRSRALILLGRFLDLGPQAINLALSVGIFPYVLKVRDELKGLTFSVYFVTIVATYFTLLYKVI